MKFALNVVRKDKKIWSFLKMERLKNPSDERKKWEDHYTMVEGKNMQMQLWL